jgi:hypothetical protein
MVRQIALEFVYGKQDSRPKTEGVGLALAFALAESSKGTRKRIASLSQTSIPYWIVQVSGSSSILLAAAGESSQTITFTESVASGEIRRVLSTEITEVKQIPEAVGNLLTLLDKTELITHRIRNLEKPGPFTAQGKMVVEIDPSAQPNRLEIKVDSQAALNISEEFQSFTSEASSRLNSMETLRKLVDEKMRSQLNIMEHVMVAEKGKWKQRARSMEEIAEIEMDELKKKREDQIYKFEEKHKMDLRAMTADFARAMADIEQFFDGMIQRVRETRTKIGRMGDNVEGGINEQRSLVEYLTDTVPQYAEILERMDEKSEQVLKTMAEFEKALDEKSNETSQDIDVQISQRKHRLVDFAMEQQQRQNELEDLDERVRAAVQSIEMAIDEKTVKLKIELDDLMALTLNNDSIKGLAPLTRLDIVTYVAFYDDGSFETFTPCFLPEKRLTTRVSHIPIDTSFDDHIKRTIANWEKADSSFAGSFKRACTRGNILLKDDAEALLLDGLNELQRKQLLQEDTKEKMKSLWQKYATRCPECGVEIESEAKFCQSCGAVLE